MPSSAAMFESSIPGLPPPKRGKVRDVYDLGDKILLVATDRISAFDVVFPTPIPDKGRVLNSLTLYWLDLLSDVIPNHLLSRSLEGLGLPAESIGELTGRALAVKKAKVVPFECIVRGYIIGSGWKDYRNSGSITILFSPDGYVDRIAFGDDASTSEFPTEPIHLLVGTWDQLSSHGDGRDEIRDNYEYVSNFWVSIDPRTGMVSVNEVNPVKIIRDGTNTTYDAAVYPNGYVDQGSGQNFYGILRETRRFANDFQRNYGGF